MNKYTFECDIAVVGGGPAGIAAAVTAAQSGKKVILVEQNAYLGGALATGLSPLSFWDNAMFPMRVGNCRTIGLLNGA